MRATLNDNRLVHLIASAQFNPVGWQRLSADARYTRLKTPVISSDGWKRPGT